MVMYILPFEEGEYWVCAFFGEMCAIFGVCAFWGGVRIFEGVCIF